MDTTDLKILKGMMVRSIRKAQAIDDAERLFDVAIKTMNKLRMGSSPIADNGLKTIGEFDFTDEDYTRMKELCFEGQKIKAIKLFREITNASLKNAKEAVESEFKCQIRV